GVRDHQAAHDPDGGRLPGAVRAQEAVDLARGHREADAPKGFHLPEALAQVGHFDHGWGRRPDSLTHMEGRAFPEMTGRWRRAASGATIQPPRRAPPAWGRGSPEVPNAKRVLIIDDHDPTRALIR